MDASVAIDRLRSKGWSIEIADSPTLRLPESIITRYPSLPDSMTSFLGCLAHCVSSDETTWFLTSDIYSGTADIAFTWDEWERLSIRSAEEDGETAWAAEIRGFWDGYFPFLYSVHGHYHYHAVCVRSDGYGTVVEGCEPMFEEFTTAASTFDEFLESFTA